MKFLKALGWVFVPYIMIGFQWNKIGTTGKAIGSAWAALCLFGLINNLTTEKQQPVTFTQTASVPASQTSTPEPTKQADPVKTETKPAEPAPKTSETNEGTMSKAEFDKIQNGMSYEEVVAIVGGPGEMLSETGTKGDQFYTVMYAWEGEGGFGANANAMFQGGKMISKSQFGLK
ncbi:DUF3862 domain-containing protein [Brevibacillus agri]|uniref:DUF3862 domain-containing protein n=1 Tax=Brevibacillus agri TaxID=51101 RepID=UPI0028682FE1|nr:DUF3862 domain-containing protein [Brevibacillus agri]